MARSLAGLFCCFTVVLGWCVATAQAEVTIDWVTVGDPGNACDSQSQGCFGAVAYEYQISKYEVTNAQYAEFLNAVAATDTYDLYNTDMAEIPYGGITRSGSPGSYTYSAIAGRENVPVFHVSFYDGQRFANWLHNGQPTGAQDASTTEDGAYTSAGGMSFGERNVDATVFLPSEDEWYKAAYYGGSGTYYDYPAGSDTQTTCSVPGSGANTANCGLVYGGPSDVGSYTGAGSPSGTFDQGGNLWEWNEAKINVSERGTRGGSWMNPSGSLAASLRNSIAPNFESNVVGFRVASLPEPVPTLSQRGLIALGMLLLTAMAWALRHRRAA